MGGLSVSSFHSFSFFFFPSLVFCGSDERGCRFHVLSLRVSFALVLKAARSPKRQMINANRSFNTCKLSRMTYKKMKGKGRGLSILFIHIHLFILFIYFPCHLLFSDPSIKVPHALFSFHHKFILSITVFFRPFHTGLFRIYSITINSPCHIPLYISIYTLVFSSLHLKHHFILPFYHSLTFTWLSSIFS